MPLILRKVKAFLRFFAEIIRLILRILLCHSVLRSMTINAATILGFLKSLADERRVFCSEMDFQIHFAWLMKEHGFDLSLEHDPGCFEANASLDIMIWKPERVAIELKYKTSRFEVETTGHSVHLKNHGAQDHGRYDFFKDVSRIEQIVATGKADKGFAVFLTNDGGYWRNGRDGTADAMFRMFEGRTVKSGSLKWAEHTGAGTMKGHEKPISLVRDYVLGWKDYMDFGKKNGLFRFLIVDVEKRSI